MSHDGNIHKIMASSIITTEIDDMGRYIIYRMEDDEITATETSINTWIEDNEAELIDKDGIAAYLLIKEG